MADFGTPVAQNVNPTGQGLQTLSGLLAIKQQQLGLQQSQASIGLTQAQEQQQQIAAKQMAGLRAYYQNFNLDQHLDPKTGTINVESVISDPAFRNAAGSDLPAAIKSLANIKQTQLSNRQSLVNLDQSTREQFQQQVGALSTRPDTPQTRELLKQTISAFASLSPEAERVAQVYGPMVENVPPGKLPQALNAVELQAMSASAQASATQPQYYNAGNKAIEVNRFAPNGPDIGSVPSSIINGLAPGTVVEKDASGNLIAFNPQNPGRVILLGHGGNTTPTGRAVTNGQYGTQGTQSQPLPRSNASQGTSSAASTNEPYPVVNGFPEPWLSGEAQSSNKGGYAPPVFSSVGQAQNIQNQAATDQKVYAAAISAGNQAPLTKNLLNNINTLSTEAIVGPGSQYVADAETVLGQYIPGMKGASDQAAKRQLLGKYIEQLLIRTAQANGYSTDQAHEIAAHANPNADMTPQAIQGAARLVMAQTEIGQAEASFAQRYYAANGSSNGFQQAQGWFLQHIDPRMFDAIGLSNQALTRKLGQWFGNNAQEKNDFIRNMMTITNMGGFDYAAEPKQ